MTSEPGSAAMADIIETVEARLLQIGYEDDDVLVSLHAFICDFQDEERNIETLTRERDEAREALKLVREWLSHISDDENIIDAADEADKMADVQIAVDAALAAAPPVPVVEEKDMVDKATAWDQCVKSSQRAREKALEEAAQIIEAGQETTSTIGWETTHSLTSRRHGNRAGLAYAAAIRALSKEPTP